MSQVRSDPSASGSRPALKRWHVEVITRAPARRLKTTHRVLPSDVRAGLLTGPSTAEARTTLTVLDGRALICTWRAGGSVPEREQGGQPYASSCTIVSRGSGTRVENSLAPLGSALGTAATSMRASRRHPLAASDSTEAKSVTARAARIAF